EARSPLGDRDGVRGVVDQLVEELRADAPALGDVHRRERRDLVLRIPVQPEGGAAARELETVALGRDPGRLLRQLTRQLLELLGRHRQRARLLDVGGHAQADRDVQVRSAHAHALAVRLDQDVGEYGQRRPCRDAGPYRCKAVLQVLPGDRESHGRLARRHRCRPGSTVNFASTMREIYPVTIVGPVELWATPSPCPYRRIPSPHSRPGPEWKTVLAPGRVSPAAHSAGRREWKNRRIPTGYPRPLWSTRQLRADR